MADDRSRAERAPVSPARLAAFRILLRIERERAYAAPLLATRAIDELSPEDRRLVQELVLGVLRWRGELDYVINIVTERAAEKLDLPVRIALWMGLYQIRHLDKIPEHAAVNETVEMLKHGIHRRAAGLANAALRTALRDRPVAPDDRVRDPRNRMSIATSHPVWLLDRWVEQFGAEFAGALALANNEHPRVTFRINTLRSPSLSRVLTELAEMGVDVQDSEIVPGAFVVVAGHLGSASRVVSEGWVYVQDEASQLIARLVGARPGERVLDVCAAPGGKTTSMAADMANEGTIIALDRHVVRLATMARVCARLGVHNVRAVAADASQELPLEDGVLFDRVLVDAPCSGTGTLRRNPEIKWRVGDSPELTTLQISLLDRAANRVRSGGRLVYSTCSLEREENEEIVGSFLGRTQDFSVLHPDAPGQLITTDSYVRTFPHLHGCDGFFGAVLERRA